MKALYLSVIALSLMAVATVNAQNFDNYDVKNTESLKQRTGFVGLHQGEEISEDYIQEQTAIPQAQIENQLSATDMNNVAPAAGGGADMPMAPSVQAPKAPMANMTAAPTVPAAPAASIKPRQPDVAMVQQPQEQTVVKEQTIIGNTDTGVNPDEILKALEEHQNR